MLSQMDNEFEDDNDLVLRPDEYSMNSESDIAVFIELLSLISFVEDEHKKTLSDIQFMTHRIQTYNAKTLSDMHFMTCVIHTHNKNTQEIANRLLESREKVKIFQLNMSDVMDAVHKIERRNADIVNHMAQFITNVVGMV